jgi:hypothetical protein
MEVSVNWLAVLVAGISAFVLGGVWYSPALFGKAWMTENKLTLDDVKKRNNGRIFGWAFILSLLMAANLGMFLSGKPEGCPEECGPEPGLLFGMLAGFLAGIWVFCGLAIIALFEHKSARYIFINGGYLVVALTLMGAIIGVWR